MISTKSIDWGEKMLQEERYQKILTVLSESGSLSIKKIQELFGISIATARRDMIELQERGLVNRTHGGVSLKSKKSDRDIPPLDIRKAHCAIEKEAIARKAATLIEPSDVLILDGGTTTLHLAKMLPLIPISVITNSLVHAQTVFEHQEGNSNIEIVLTGGILFGAWSLTYGPPALACLSEYHANWLFLSGQGINENGLFNPNALVVEVEKAMVKSADKVVVLADHSKIGSKSMSRVCALGDIDYLITTSNAEVESQLNVLEENGIEIIRVPSAIIIGNK